MKKEWIKIYESYELKGSKLNTQIWLNEILRDNNIPYKNEIVNYWEGNPRMPKYTEKLFVYIPSEFKKQVENYIEEYASSNNTTDRVTEKFDNSDDEVEIINEKQRKMKLGLAIVVITMVLTAIFGMIFAQ